MKNRATNLKSNNPLDQSDYGSSLHIRHIQKDIEKKRQKREAKALKAAAFKKEQEENREEARKAVMDRVYNASASFSYSDIEDIMSDYGLEMDGIEDFF